MENKININKICLMLLCLFSFQFFAFSQSNIRFAVIGDYGDAGSDEQAVANLVNSWNVDFIITLGDNNYSNGSASTIDENIGQYFHQYIYPYVGTYGEGSDVNRFFPTLGNHDWNTNPPQPYYDYFRLPQNERYYHFIKGNVHFFAIDSDTDEPDGVTENSIQGQWLQNALASSSALWNVVYFHHSPYSSSSSHGSQEYMQWPFKEWGASVVLAGHDHTYERVIIDDFPYFVNGLGGRSIYNFDSTPVPGSQVRYNNNYGAMLVEANLDSITFNFYSINNELIDIYSIVNLITDVELKSFRAKVIENDVQLDWLTATETNNHGFEIQKCSSPIIQSSEVEQEDWVKIGFIPGHGTTTKGQEYSFIDKSVIHGFYRYRLKQIDYDGSFEYSNSVDVEVGDLFEFSLKQNYPNPFNPVTKIKFTIPSDLHQGEVGLNSGMTNVSLIIYDIIGNKIATLVNEEKPAGSYEVELNVETLSNRYIPSSIYFYQLKAGNFVATKKMVYLK